MDQTLPIRHLFNLRQLPLERLGFVATTLGPLLASLPSTAAFDLVRRLLDAQRKSIADLGHLENEWARVGPHQARAMEALNRQAANSPALQALNGTADAMVTLACNRLELDSALHPPGSPEAEANYRLFSTLFAKGAKFITQQAFTAQLFTYEELANSLQLPSVVADFALLHLDSLRLRMLATLQDFVEGARAADLHMTRGSVSYPDIIAAREAAQNAHCETFAAILAATTEEPELRATLLAPFLHVDAEVRKSRNPPTASSAPTSPAGGPDSTTSGS